MALEAGVLEAAPPDPVLRFSHPLLRETAEGMLTGPARRRLHRVIGAALDDPDQAAWHLARGADEPDEALAERAEQPPRNASSRGATARAAALARSAAELTPDPDSQPAWRRRITGLERLVAASEFDQVRRSGRKMGAACPRRAARAADRRTRGCREATSRRRADLYAEAFQDLAGNDPARAAQVGAHIGHQGLGVILGRLAEARPGTRPRR